LEVRDEPQDRSSIVVGQLTVGLDLPNGALVSSFYAVSVDLLPQSRFPLSKNRNRTRSRCPIPGPPHRFDANHRTRNDRSGNVLRIIRCQGYSERYLSRLRGHLRGLSALVWKAISQIKIARSKHRRCNRPCISSPTRQLGEVNPTFFAHSIILGSS
jgi:hypothetical protein